MASIAAALGYRLWCSFKRKWILMLVFICIPILLSMLFILVKTNGGLSKGSREEGPIIYQPYTRAHILSSSCTLLTPIAVCPDNNSTRTLMSAVKNIFGKDVVFGPVVFKQTAVEVAEYLSNITQDSSLFGSCGYGINFNELTSTNLTYYLRSIHADNWVTNQAFPSSMVPGPMDVGDFYLSKGFVALQVAINEAYSLSILNISLPDWELQPFPYPRYQKEDQYAVLYLIMGYMNAYGITLLLVRFAVMMIQEKSGGIKELLKINGIKTWMVYASWYFMFGLITFIIAIAISIIWKFPMSNVGAVLPATNPAMLLLILTIYYWAALASVGFLASLINEPKYGTLVIVVYWIGSDMLVAQVLTSFRTNTLLFLFALLPNGGIFGIFEAISEFEAAGSGAEFANLFSYPPVAKTIFPIGLNLGIMVLSMLIYLTLMAYIGAIKPGPYGRARPWHFIFPTRLWSRVEAEKVEVFSGENGSPSRSLIEPVGNEAVGLETVNLLKIFGSLVAVDHLNLKIYKNQITALLGHNGAGKSTLFSMISGMYSPTSGSVRTGDYEIFHGNNLERFRRDLGFCPQHDLLIDDLSVEQHLIFFGMVKGLTYAEAKRQSDHWTNKFKIHEGRHKQVAELSGGMKRKLCLAVALVGNPQWLLLDEPTSGLDPESRRDIWDVLLTIRGNRTIVISTHFMEEADVLGDRIAIVAHGQLKCYGTAMFLKRHYGSGYQLNFTTNKGVRGLMNEIKKHILSATLINETETTLLVGLPAAEVQKFPELFRAIESKYGDTVESSLSCTTMDDVFLKVQEDEGVQMTIDEVDMPTMIRETHDRRARQTKGFKIWQQMEGFIIKRYKWAFCNWPSFLVFMVLCPILGSWMTMSGCNSAQERNNIDQLAISLNMYKDSLVLVDRKFPKDTLAEAFEKATVASGSSFKEISGYPNITTALLDYAGQDLLHYRSKMVVALDSSSDMPNALYSTLAFHSIPVAYGMLANALIKQVNSPAEIQTYNYPYKFNAGSCSSTGSSSMVQMVFLWIVMGLTVLVTTSYFIVFPHTERVTQIKHLQLMTGAHPIIYWLTILIADFTLYMLPVVLCIIMVAALDTYKLFSYCIFLGSFTMVLILFGLGAILFAYFCSYFFKNYTSSMELCIFLSSMSAIVSLVGSQFEQTEWFPYVFNLLPWIPFVQCLVKMVQWASKASVCSTCKVGTYAAICKTLVDDATVSSFDMKEELIYLAVDPLLYLVLILLIEAGLFRAIMAKLDAFLYGPIIDSSDPSDLDVAGEKELVDAAKGDPRGNGTPPIFVCDHLGKKFRRSLTATYDVAFTIQKGECFGLLGVNGAGKSTTFGMLTGSLTPTRGNARIMNYGLSGNRTQYLKRLGYCPQLDGLLPELSARTLLSLFGRLRGVPSSELSNITQKWIDVLDMTNICDRPCKDYSGGNKRKLSTAMALIADPPIVLLDEPTTGVDPVIRRKIWAILKHCREANGQTVIITSHSMDECEAVCGRLTIMVKGLMKCIGTVPRLKTVYGQGYILLVKLMFSCSQEEAEQVQSKIETTFSPNIRLQDKQHGLFNFHITSKTVKLHYMFDTMLDLRSKYDVIEDFSLSDISLEQVFLSLAKDK